MSSTALRAGGILRALTDDHPPQSLRGSPPGPATTDVLRTTILLLACQLDFAYKQLRCLLNGSAASGGARQQSPRDALNQIRPRVTKALAIPSSWMSVVVMSQKHSMP
ncbi:hypothetical protein B0085_0591 [Bifidobacterium bifidum]|nr:hypothetical protein B0085_0591 [Bifidobacterium bifidum]